MKVRIGCGKLGQLGDMDYGSRNRMREVGSAVGRYGSENEKWDQWEEMEVEMDSRII